MEIDSKAVCDMLFECLHRLGKHVKGKNHSIIVKLVLDEEMQIVWGKRKMLNGTTYDISSLFAAQTHNTRSDIKSFLHMQDTVNHTVKMSKDKLLMDGKPVMVPVYK